MYKKFKSLTGFILVFLICIGLSIGSFAKNVSVKDRDSYSFSYVSDVLKQIDKLDFLSDQEKNVIKEEYQRTLPYYNKILVFEHKAKKIYDRIMKTAKPFNKKYDSLYSANKKLWPVLESEFKDSVSYKKLKRTQMLEKTTKLTEEEKKLLLEDAKQLDELDVEISNIQKRADKSVLKLKSMIDKEWKELDILYEDSLDIWEKIFKNFEVK